MIEKPKPPLPSPETTLVILLGASEFPRANFHENNAFKVAAEKMHRYFTSTCSIPEGNICWLFDTELNRSQIEEEIRKHLEKFKAKARDVIVYYVGHGDKSSSNNNRLYLAIRDTWKGNPEGTSIQVKSLVKTVLAYTRRMRRFYILDCCYAGAAIRDMQGDEQAASLSEAFKRQEVAEEYETRGYGGIFSSDKKMYSVALPDGSNTFFTEAFLRVLADGDSSADGLLSIRNVHKKIDNMISLLHTKYLVTHKGEQLMPPLVQSNGVLTGLPLFPRIHDELLVSKEEGKFPLNYQVKIEEGMDGDQDASVPISPLSPRIVVRNKGWFTKVFFLPRSIWFLSPLLILCILGVVLLPRIWLVSSPSRASSSTPVSSPSRASSSTPVSSPTPIPPAIPTSSAKRGTPLFTYNGHINTIESVEWSPDGSQIATSSLDNTMQVWSAKNGKMQQTYDYGTHPYAIVWLPDGPLIAALQTNTSIEVRNGNGQTVLSWNYPISVYAPDASGFTFSHLTWSPDGKYLAFASSANGAQFVAIYVLSIAKKTLLFMQSVAQSSSSTVVDSIAWSPDSKRIAYIESTDGNIQVIDVATEKQILQYNPYDNFNGGVSGLAWSPDGKYLVSGASNGDPTPTNGLIYICDAKTGKTLYTYHGHNSGITSIAWSPNAKYIASADNTHIDVWRAFTGKNVYVYDKQPGQILALAWSPDSTRIASVGMGQKNGTGEAMVWQAV